MANDLFGGLGGLMKGLSSFMPQDDPNVKLMQAQTEIEDLKKQENELFAEIGRKAYAENPSAFPQNDRIKLIQSNIVSAQAKLETSKSEQLEAKKAKEQAENARLCPNCDTLNPEGVRFCQECGSKVGLITSAFCQGCGKENPPNTRFCGGCGMKIGD